MTKETRDLYVHSIEILDDPPSIMIELDNAAKEVSLASASAVAAYARGRPLDAVPRRRWRRAPLDADATGTWPSGL
jgi:hypothetical protein